MKTFEINKEYAGAFNYDRNATVTVRITNRTGKTVSYYAQVDGKEKLITKKITKESDCEKFFYSKRGGNFVCIRSL